MKKLKIKVFSTIFTILTIFVLIITATSITRNYIERRKSISEILTNVSRTINVINKNKKDKPNLPPNNIPTNQDIRRIYLDFTIYTIILDENDNFQETINHTNNDEFDMEYIKSIAKGIIDNHTKDFHIGNLYTDKYAYFFTSNNTLIIMDNSNLNNIMINQLITSLSIFTLCEIIIFIITNMITEWIITPVKKSFEKQKIFVADASHELKTPLSVIIASADAYFNDKDDKWVHNIKNESERMSKLVKELLDLAKTEKEQEMKVEVNNLSSIIESFILTLESLFYDNKIKLKYQIEPQINLLCNEDAIRELMSILIDNAIKHCSQKGKVIVNLFKNNKQIILEVKNTGLPINKEDEKKIFERFYKLDSSRNRNANNYGLGLAIAQNIVQQHKGSITANSSNGYTTFKVIWNQK